MPLMIRLLWEVKPRCSEAAQVVFGVLLRASGSTLTSSCPNFA
jgi:hypothetical protein